MNEEELRIQEYVILLSKNAAAWMEKECPYIKDDPATCQLLMDAWIEATMQADKKYMIF